MHPKRVKGEWGERDIVGGCEGIVLRWKGALLVYACRDVREPRASSGVPSRPREIGDMRITQSGARHAWGRGAEAASRSLRRTHVAGGAARMIGFRPDKGRARRPCPSHVLLRTAGGRGRGKERDLRASRAAP